MPGRFMLILIKIPLFNFASALYYVSTRNSIALENSKSKIYLFVWPNNKKILNAKLVANNPMKFKCF